MVVIRLARAGAVHKPFYRIMVTDSRRARDGRFIERVGFYNPLARGKEVSLQLNRERIEYWLSQGAQASQRVAHLMRDYDKLAHEASSDEVSSGAAVMAQSLRKSKPAKIADNKQEVEK